MTEQHINHSLDILTSPKSGFKKGSKGSGLISLFGYQTDYDLTKGMPLATTKYLFRRQATEELLWFMKGDTNIKPLEDKDVKVWRGNAFEYNLPGMIRESILPGDIVKYSSDWDDAMIMYGDMIREDRDGFAEQFGDSGPIYPEQWRRWAKYNKVSNQIKIDGKFQDIYTRDPNGIDQLANMIEGLKKKPQGKKHIVSAWNPADVPKMSLPPCHVLYQASCDENGGLELHLYQRSSDMFLGVPFNDLQYSYLTAIIANEIGGFPKRLIHSFGDTHFYTGLGNRTPWYRENIEELKKRVSDERPSGDFSGTLEWIDKNAPKDIDNPDSPSEERYDHVTAILEQASNQPLPSPQLKIADRPFDELEYKDFKLIDYNHHQKIERGMLV